VRWYGKKGEKFRIEVQARQLEFPTDPIVTIRDDSEKVLATNDDASGGKDSQVDFTVPADGEYTMEVRDLYSLGSAKHRYEMTIDYLVPQFQVTVASDIIQGVAGKPIEVPLTVTNELGSGVAWDVGLSGLKYHVESEVVEVPPAEQGKPSTWKLVLKADHAFQQHVRLSADSFAPNGGSRWDLVRLPAGQAPSEFWLSVLPAEAAPTQ
jgi:hypothetical protein